MSAKAQLRAPTSRTDTPRPEAGANVLQAPRSTSNADRIEQLNAARGEVGGPGDGCGPEKRVKKKKKTRKNTGNPQWSTKPRYVGKLKKPRVRIDPVDTDANDSEDETEWTTEHEPLEVRTEGHGSVDGGKDSRDLLFGHPERFPGKRDKLGEPVKTQHFALGQHPLYADAEDAVGPRGSKKVDEEEANTVTGTFRFAIGETEDRPDFGGKARFTVTAVTAEGRTVVFEQKPTTTLGHWQTVVLTDLPADATYEVDIDLDTWWGGQTTYRYQLHLEQKVVKTTTFEVEKKKKVEK